MAGAPIHVDNVGARVEKIGIPIVDKRASLLSVRLLCNEAADNGTDLSLVEEMPFGERRVDFRTRQILLEIEPLDLEGHAYLTRLSASDDPREEVTQDAEARSGLIERVRVMPLVESDRHHTLWRENEHVVEGLPKRHFEVTSEDSTSIVHLDWLYVKDILISYLVPKIDYILGIFLIKEMDSGSKKR